MDNDREDGRIGRIGRRGRDREGYLANAPKGLHLLPALIAPVACRSACVPLIKRVAGMSPTADPVTAYSYCFRTYEN